MNQVISESDVWEPSEYFRVLALIELASKESQTNLLESLSVLLEVKRNIKRESRGLYVDFSAQFPHLAVLEVQKKLTSAELHSFFRERSAVRFTVSVWQQVKQFLSKHGHPTNEWYFSLGREGQLWKMCGDVILPYVIHGPMDMDIFPGRRVLCVYNKNQERDLLNIAA